MGGKGGDRNSEYAATTEEYEAYMRDGPYPLTHQQAQAVTSLQA